MRIEIIEWYQYKNLKDNNNNIDTVYLCSDSWNDYGYYTLFNISYISKTNKYYDLRQIRIANIGSTNKLTIFKKFNYKRLPKNYISLGGKTYYEKINNIDKIDEFRDDFFKSMNDIAYDLNLYELNKNTNVVQKSLLRFPDSYEVERLLHKMAKDGLSMYTAFSWDYIYNQSESLTFTVNPKEIIPNNIFVIIGENQVGKTTMLNNIFDELCEKKNKSEVLENNSQLDYKEVYLIRNSTLDNINICKYNQDSYFVIENLKQEQRNNLLKKVINRINNRDTELYREIFLIVQERINSQAISSLFKMIFDQYGYKKRSLKLDNCCKSYDLFDSKINSLSSGNKVIFYILMLVIANSEIDSIFLVDEPESHLHPSLQVGFIRVLKEILQKLNGMAILATHSPLFLQCIPKMNVFIMSRVENQFFIENPKIETFGASFGELFNEVLAVDTVHSVYGDVVDNIIETEERNNGKNNRKNQIWEKYGNNLGSLASMKLLREIHS